MRQRCGPIQRVSIEDGPAMEKSNETTHAAPELVNRSSIYTLHRPCDLDHGHDKTSHSGPTTMQHCPDNSAEAKTKSSIHMADQRQRTPIVGVESVEKKRTHMKFALPTMCEHNTRPTWHMTPPQTNQLCFASRCVTSRYSTTPSLAHRPCLSNDDVSERHDTNHDRCTTACHVFSQMA